jgi:hypothetical protein
MPSDDRNRRSIWRETKFLVLTIFNNLIDFDLIIQDFANISTRLFVEKRANGRKLQLVPI